MRWTFAACLTAVLVWSHAFAADGGSGGRVRDPEVRMCPPQSLRPVRQWGLDGLCPQTPFEHQALHWRASEGPAGQLAALARALRRGGMKVAGRDAGIRSIGRHRRRGIRPHRAAEDRSLLPGRRQADAVYPTELVSKVVVSETTPYTMTALVKAAMLGHPKPARAEGGARKASDDGR